MAGSSDKLYFFEVIAFTLSIVTIVFFGQLSNFLLVVLANKLSYNFLSNVSTYIFIVIAFTSHLLLPNFFKNVKPSTVLICYFLLLWDLLERTVVVDDDIVSECLSRPDIPYKWSFWYLIGMGEYFAKKGVIGFAACEVEKKSLLVFVHASWILKIYIFFVRIRPMLIHCINKIDWL